MFSSILKSKSKSEVSMKNNSEFDARMSIGSARQRSISTSSISLQSVSSQKSLSRLPMPFCKNRSMTKIMIVSDPNELAQMHQESINKANMRRMNMIDHQVEVSRGRFESRCQTDEDIQVIDENDNFFMMENPLCKR